jgi:sulfatase modifying factor 1
MTMGHSRLIWYGNFFPVAILLGIALAGCSSEEAPVSSPTIVASPAPPPAAAPAGNSNAGRPPQAKPKPAPSATDPKDDPPEPDEFTVGVSRPNYVVRPASLPVGTDRFSRAGQPGVAGDQFTVALAAVPVTGATEQNPEVTFPEGFTPLPEFGFDDLGWPRRIRCDVDGAVMALVSGGAGTMGVDGFGDDVGPAVPVAIDPFYMDITEVTVKRYAQFREANKERRPEAALNGNDRDDFPALGISWRDAAAYCRWTGKSLPTEAEWELAGRGSNGDIYPWGNGRPVWPKRRDPGDVLPTGASPNDQSAAGIFDLAGNAREWTNDWYSEETFRNLVRPDGAPAVNPTGPTRASIPNARVVKGQGTAGWALWGRAGIAMKETLPDIGFRGVLRPGKPATEAEADAGEDRPARPPRNFLD